MFFVTHFFISHILCKNFLNAFFLLLKIMLLIVFKEHSFIHPLCIMAGALLGSENIVNDTNLALARK